MTTFEILTSTFSAVTIIFLAAGLILTIKQLTKISDQIKQGSLIHSQNHKWNRMIASQEALFNYSSLSETQELIKEFNILNRKEPIPLSEIQIKFDQKPELQNYSHKLLNLYEGLARGIHHGVYEEQIIKDARKTVMKKIFNSYRSYIEHRRSDNHKSAWTEFESIVNKWHYEDSSTEFKEKTGNI